MEPLISGKSIGWCGHISSPGVSDQTAVGEILFHLARCMVYFRTFALLFHDCNYRYIYPAWML